MIREFCDHERQAAEAVIKREQALVGKALAIHPRAARAAQTQELARRLAEVIVREDIQNL